MRINYYLYLRSPHWRSVRKKYIARHGWKCQKCGKTRSMMHLHHLNYDCLYKEQDKDLMLLCKSCHRKVHGIKKSGKRRLSFQN